MATRKVRKRNSPDMRIKRRVPERYQTMMDAVEDGTFSLDMLDEEEILRGRIRNAAGDFRGRPPVMIPHALAVELVRRQQRIIREQLGPLSRDALNAISDLVNGKTTVNDGPRVQAAKLALEYALGKPSEKVEINVDQKVTHYQNVILQSTAAIEEKVEDEL